MGQLCQYISGRTRQNYDRRSFNSQTWIIHTRRRLVFSFFRVVVRGSFIRDLRRGGVPSRRSSHATGGGREMRFPSHL